MWSGLFVIPYNPKALKMRLAAALGKLKDPVIHQVELNVKKGLKLIEKKEYKKALGLFQTLVNRNENPEYYYNIGYIKTAQNKYYEAIEGLFQGNTPRPAFRQGIQSHGHGIQGRGCR